MNFEVLCQELCRSHRLQTFLGLIKKLKLLFPDFSEYFPQLTSCLLQKNDDSSNK